MRSLAFSQFGATFGQSLGSHVTVATTVKLLHGSLATAPSSRAEATLDRVEGRRLTFTVSVMCNQTLVAVGKVTRVVVNREQFIEKAG